jgi:hypothetical protein
MLGISFLSCEMTFIARDRKRDLHDRNPASTDNFSGKQSDLAYPTGGNDTDLFDPAPHLVFIHLPSSFSHSLKRHHGNSAK